MLVDGRRAGRILADRHGRLSLIYCGIFSLKIRMY